MDHATIIERLGGPSAVARLTKRHPSRASRWRSEGIPRQHWPELIRAAEAAGKCEITMDALLSGEPMQSAEARA